MELERVKQEIIRTRKIEKKYKVKKKNSPYYSDILIIWLVSFIIRIYRVEKGNFVMWDEAHFGKFAGHYLNREFFFDVHPPLGKLLTAFGGWVSGMAKDFPFTSEEVYPVSVDFVSMRIFHSLFGSFIPVFGYSIVRSMLMKRGTAIAISIGLIFDNALIGISRLILLDPFLIFFIGLSEVFLCRVVMDNRRVQSVSSDLVGLGVSIGLAMSVKWVGLLTVAHVGIFAVYILLQEIRKRSREFFCLFFRLFFTLILIPLSIYTGVFLVHFLLLTRTGPGDGEMSSRFQSFLQENEVLSNNSVVSYGNKVSIRSSTVGTGLLHSHVDRYPDGGQQVTTYPHKDGNNHWRILKVGENPEEVKPYEDLVLYHTETNRYLTVESGQENKERSAQNEDKDLDSSAQDKQDKDSDKDKLALSGQNRNTEKSALNTSLLGVDDESSYSIPENGKKALCQSQEEMGGVILSTAVFHIEPVVGDRVDPLSTLFYIRNTQHNCYISYSGKKLPKWGHQQGEIFCSSKKVPGSVWNIEMNRSEEIEEQKKEPTKMTVTHFFRNILELNKAMNTVNSSLVSDGADTIGTEPIEWIFPRRWLKFNKWDGSVPRFAMVGNVLTWYLGSANILLLVFYSLSALSRRDRGSNKYISRRNGRSYILLGGWLFHLAPFFLVKRILYLHHYIPSLFFSVLGLGIVLNRRRVFCWVFSVCVFIGFLCFSPITYGYSGSLERTVGYSLFPHWNIYEE